MPKRAIAKLWTVLGGLLAAFSAYSWLASQGGPLLGTSLFPEARPTIAAYYAIIVIAILLWLVCAVGVAHLGVIERGGSFLSRFPMFAVEDRGDLKPTRWSYRVYQCMTLLLVLILPLAAQFHLSHKVYDNAVVWSPKAAEKRAGFGARIHSVNMGCYLHIDYGWACEDFDFLRGRERKFADKREDLELYLCFRTQKSCSDYENLNVSPGCRKDRRTCRGEDFIPVLTPSLPALLVLFSTLTVGYLFRRAWANRNHEPHRDATHWS